MSSFNFKEEFRKVLSDEEQLKRKRLPVIFWVSLGVAITFFISFMSLFIIMLRYPSSFEIFLTDKIWGVLILPNFVLMISIAICVSTAIYCMYLYNKNDIFVEVRHEDKLLKYLIELNYNSTKQFEELEEKINQIDVDNITIEELREKVNELKTS